MKDLYLFTKTREGSDSLKVRIKYRQKTRQQFKGLIYKRSQQFGTGFRIYLKIMIDYFLGLMNSFKLFHLKIMKPKIFLLSNLLYCKFEKMLP